MDFDSKGFLGSQIDKLMESFIEKSTEWYKLLFEINEYGNELRNRMVINQDSVEEVVAAALLVKAMNTFQSIILLSRKGLAADCGTLTRSLIETVIPLRLISQESEFAVDFIKYEKRKRQKLMNVIFNNRQIFSEIIDQVSEDLRDSLKKEIDEEGIPELKIEELAQRSGMATFYQLAYRHLSEDAHTTIWSLNRYLLTDDEGDVNEIDNGPQIFDISDFKTTAYCMLIALDSANNFFRLDVDMDIQAFETRLKGTYGIGKN